MRIIYECEKLAVLQDNELFIVHILDNYRMVKEIVVNQNNLLSTLKNEFNKPEQPKCFFGKKIQNCILEIENIVKKTILN